MTQLLLVPSGYCQCGCGNKTHPAKHTDKRNGTVKGEPTRFLHGHGKLAAQPNEAPATKTCTRCKKTKRLERFRLAKRAAHGRHSICKACNNAYVRKWRLEKPPEYFRDLNLRRATGGTLVYWEQQNEAQQGVCAICNQPETRLAPNNRTRVGALALDHDHDSGQLRGLLCSSCNLALGGFKDSPDLLRNALAYLTRWGKPATTETDRKVTL